MQIQLPELNHWVTADHLWKIVTKLFDYTNSVHDSLLLVSTF